MIPRKGATSVVTNQGQIERSKTRDFCVSDNTIKNMRKRTEERKKHIHHVSDEKLVSRTWKDPNSLKLLNMSMDKGPG